MEFLLTLAGFIGPIGVILVVLGCIATYLCLRNGIYLHLVGRDFCRRFDNLGNRQQGYIDELCGATTNPLTQIVASVVKTHAEHSQDLRAEVAYLFHRNFERVNKHVTYLRLIAVISPLLGLMGTMVGMVRVFQEIAASAVPQQDMLAAGIWEAILTTILGLGIAVPTLVFYYVLSLKLKGFRIEAIEHSYRAVELLDVRCPVEREAS
ncbi:MotA/TolQ/ExbB proton channel family protein [Desulfurispira natronophila]|uniref:Biopolymer transport protein ExbB n=1 Tax=Desulfurispira natronophila TaxID=682562 RepID=A0A7W7Y413_9BACT|nr:MotA/TolQ/ExbB proton channel family protein [Desulfurispira natronophila]MBB5021534.1 biopolymer transport protein ExbB [Desulfurispira natronophila]